MGTPFPGEQAPGRVQRAALEAHGLWHLDVANALLVAERHGVITTSASDLFWARLSSLPIDTDRDAIQERQSRVRTLARDHGLSSFDRRLNQAATDLG